MSACFDDAPQTWTCPEHGIEYGHETGSRFDCPACQRAADRAVHDWQAEWDRWTHWTNGSGIPRCYRSATADLIQPVSPDAQKLKTTVTRFTAAHSLLLLGPPGVGKTLALCSIINAACARAVGPVYAVWPDVLTELKAGFNGPRDDKRRLAAERLRHAPLLALDEIGVRGMSEFDHGELFGLIDYRYREGLPTLVAANSTRAAFSTLVGERIADRLREVGPTLSLAGQSQRGLIDATGPDAFPEPPTTLTVRVHATGAMRERHFHHPRTTP